MRVGRGETQLGAEAEGVVLGREDPRAEDNWLTGLYAGSVQKKLRSLASGDSQEFGLV